MLTQFATYGPWGLAVAILCSAVVWLARRLLAVQDQRVADMERYASLAERNATQMTSALAAQKAASDAQSDALERVEDALRNGTPPPYRVRTPR